MSTELIGLIGVIAVLILMFARMWVGMAMMLVGIVGCAILSNWDAAGIIAGVVPYSEVANYKLSAVPLFILMGCVLSVTGLGADLYNFARCMLNRIKGGLAMATIAACGLFSAVCGDSVATAVTMGKVAYPEMKKYGYDDKLSGASIVAGGTLGVMIPPSISFIIYGLITEQSIGKLFMAGIIPGVTQILFYFVVVSLLCRAKPSIAPGKIEVTREERLKSIKPVWPILFIFIFMLIGLYTGMFTPTEAGASCAALSIIVGLALKRFTRKSFGDAFKESLQTTCMVFLIFIGAYVFMRFISLSNLPGYLSTSIVTWQQVNNIPPVVVIGLIVLFYIITGAVMDALAVILLTLPIIFPIIIGMGWDPIWWGVITVRVIEISMITPPVGLNLFVVTKAIDVPISTLYKGALPFVIADVMHVALLIALPQLSLFIPKLMG